MEPIDNTLKENLTFGDKPMFPVILKFGLIGSGILIVLLLIQRFAVPPADMDNSTLHMIVNLAISFLNFVVYVLIMGFAANTYKKLNGGFVSLGKAFGVTFLTGLIMAFAGFICSIILMSLFGLNIADANEVGNVFGDMSEPSTIGLIALASGLSLLGGCFVGAVIALVISLIVKKEKPMTFNVN